MSTAADRVAALEAAFYRFRHDRERMAALLDRAAEFVVNDALEPAPMGLMQLRWAEQQRLARQLRQYARELLSADSDEG